MRKLTRAIYSIAVIAALTISASQYAYAAEAADCNSAAISTMAPSNPDGSRKSPYEIKKGVELNETFGTAYLQLKTVFKGSAAVKKAKALTKKKKVNRLQLDTQLKQKGNRQLIVLKMYVKAKSGFEDCSLYGGSYSVNSFSLYNSKATNRLKNVDTVYLDKGQASDVELYNGGHDVFYTALILPKSVKSFCSSISVEAKDENGFSVARDCWMRYSL